MVTTIIQPKGVGEFLPPANLTATPISFSQIELAWSAVPTASGYDIGRDSVLLAVAHPGTEFVDEGLDPATEHFVPGALGPRGADDVSTLRLSAGTEEYLTVPITLDRGKS